LAALFQTDRPARQILAHRVPEQFADQPGQARILLGSLFARPGGRLFIEKKITAFV
jgi:hypothetical protein